LSPISRSFPFLFFLFALPPLAVQASLLEETTPVLSTQDRRFFDRTLLDAQKGDPAAMGILGLLYEKGTGCPKNLDKALNWLTKGAKKGDAAAENNLGFLYFQGIGVKENDLEALRWFKKAADQGLASAQSNLGLMFARGAGVPKDLSTALDWFRKAADQDDLDAQVNLAQMLSLGEGGPKDFPASYQWFLIALDHPDLEGTQKEELRDDLLWLEKRMTGAQIQDAKQKAEDWRENHSSKVDRQDP
jgi:TPR repeat protein